MKFSDRDLDKIFKEKLGEYEVEAPASAWEQVRRQALDKRSRRFPWLWVGVGAVVISIIAAAIFLPLDESGDAGAEADRSGTEQLIPADRDEQQGDNALNRNADDQAEMHIMEELSQRQVDETMAVPSDSDERTSATKPNTRTTDIEDEVQTEASRNVSDREASREAGDPAYRSSADAGNDFKSKSAHPSSEEINTGPDVIDDKTIALDAQDETIERHFGTLDKLSAPSSPFDAFERRILTQEESAWVDPCQNGIFKGDECYGIKSNTPIRFSLSWYYGPEFPLRSLTTTDPELSSYADLRNESESYAYSHGMGIRGSMKWYSGLKVSSGLHLSKWQEKLDYVDEDAETVNIINVTVDTLVDASDTIIVWDTISITQKGTKHYRNTNSYTFVDLPILIGYEVEGKNLNISINTGVFLHLLFQTEGQVLAADEKPIRYNNRDRTDHSIFKTNIGASLYTSVGFYYKLDKHWDLKFEPSIKYMIKPVTLSSYPLEQRYISFNLYMGMRYRF